MISITMNFFTQRDGEWVYSGSYQIEPVEAAKRHNQVFTTKTGQLVKWQAAYPELLLKTEKTG